MLQFATTCISAADLYAALMYVEANCNIHDEIWRTHCSADDRVLKYCVVVRAASKLMLTDGSSRQLMLLGDPIIFLKFWSTPARCLWVILDLD